MVSFVMLMEATGTILSIVGQARHNNKEIHFQEILWEVDLTGLCFSEDRAVPIALQALKKIPIS